MNELIHLSELTRGESGQVVDLTALGEYRRRLMDLGLVPGTVVKAEMISPLGDPVAYRIKDALVALRRDQADLVVVVRQDSVKAK